jgi:hypothetical protein
MIAPVPARTDFLTQGAFCLGPNQRKLHKLNRRNPGPVESNARFLARTREYRLWTRNVTFVVLMVVVVTSRTLTHEGLKTPRRVRPWRIRGARIPSHGASRCCISSARSAASSFCMRPSLRFLFKIALKTQQKVHRSSRLARLCCDAVAIR